MARVTGVGGVFVRSPDPEALIDWYRRHLGFPDEDGAVVFRWESPGSTTWHAFPADTGYLGPPGQQSMFNFRVDDLDAVLESLAAAGVPVERYDGDHEFGKFGWAIDPDGRRIELWEPAPGQ